MAYKDPFNFYPIEGKKKHPNYRVEYLQKNVSSVSCPAVFQSDEEAVEAAIKESPDWIKIGLNIVRVLKYGKDGLKEIFRKVF